MPNLGGSNKMLTADETADRLSISKSTLYHNYLTWGLKTHKFGRLLRFRERDVEQFIASKEVR